MMEWSAALELMTMELPPLSLPRDPVKRLTSHRSSGTATLGVDAFHLRVKAATQNRSRASSPDLDGNLRHKANVGSISAGHTARASAGVPSCL